MLVSEFLFTGRDNARTARELCAQLKISGRDLTNAVENERRQGVPICSATGGKPGYYLAANREEMEAFCRSLAHRAGEIFATRRACLSTLDGLPAEEPQEAASWAE